MQVNKSTHCLNCGTEIGDANYCPGCGQLNSDRKVSLRQLLGDFFGDWFAFDSKWFRSLRPLLLKPGFLTREYLAGRRTAYILPLRFYIFTTLLFFVLYSMLGNFRIVEEDLLVSLDDDSLTDSTLIAIDSLRVDSGKAPLFTASPAAAESLAVADSGAVVESPLQGQDISIDDSAAAEDGYSFFERKIAYLEGLGDRRGAVLGKEMLNQLPNILFLLLPLFALILKLLYLRRRVFFVEHLVFALHFHTFLFLILILTVLLPFEYLVLALWLGTFPYLFQSLRVVYGQDPFRTTVKFLLLFLMYSFCLIPAALGLLFLSIATV